MSSNRYIELGENFLENCVFDGLAHSYDVKNKKYVKPYPEVTGYILKYFSDYHDYIENNIIEAANYLVEIQDKHVGGYYSFDNKNILYSFDTAQITRGLLALYKKMGKKKYLDAALLGGEFILNSQESCGFFKPYYKSNINGWVIRDETYEMWNGPTSGLMCKLTEVLVDLYEVSGDERFMTALNRAADFYEKVEYIEYSHPLGYWMEGLLAAGKTKKVKNVVEKYVLNRVKENGFISYTNDISYAYVSGTIQLGIILYKLGYVETAVKIRNYGRTVQAMHESGGLFQYANMDGTQNNCIHSEINSWGTKYFCELERLLA